MSNAPVYEIDLKSFWRDPYPDLKAMRETTPIAYVPQLGATLLTKRDDIFVNEKKTEYFSSDQPQGLMTVLMGQNLMRKDGQEHMAERRAIFPAVSPRTVKTVWIKQFHACVAEVLERCKPLGKADMVKDIAMPIARCRRFSSNCRTCARMAKWNLAAGRSEGRSLYPSPGTFKTFVSSNIVIDKYFLSYAGHCKINEAPPILEGR